MSDGDVSVKKINVSFLLMIRYMMLSNLMYNQLPVAIFMQSSDAFIFSPKQMSGA